MGQIIGLVCRDCSREQYLHIGSGMMHVYFTLDDIVSDLRGEVKKEVEALLKTTKVISNECHKELLACPKCNTLSTYFSFELFDKQGKCVYKSKFNCSHCKTALVPAEKEMTDYCCRYCFSPSLSNSGLVGLWD